MGSKDNTSQDNDFDKQIAFIKEIDKLKFVLRRTALFNSDRRENDAEHSWHLAVMALVLSDHANKQVDMLKVIKMLLIHDIVEIDAGDTFLYDTTKSHVNTDEERLAANRIFGMLPVHLAEDLQALWEEFEAGESHEAMFAKSIDRFAPILQNHTNNGGTWRQYDVPYETVIEKKKGIAKGSEALWKYAKSLIDRYYGKHSDDRGER